MELDSPIKYGNQKSSIQEWKKTWKTTINTQLRIRLDLICEPVWWPGWPKTLLQLVACSVSFVVCGRAISIASSFLL